METVAIVGVGLIGGSFALALKKNNYLGKILGVSSPATIEAAIELGAIHAGVTIEEACEQADLIYLAQPIRTILKTIETISQLVRPDCLVPDAGSTKTDIVMAASRLFTRGQF